MADRTTWLAKLSAGDIFHARAPNGASLICLVLSLDKGLIQARRITTQESIEFDRGTGIKLGDDRKVPCIIDSIAPLPAEFRDIFLKLDEKYQTLNGMDKKERFEDHERLKLTKAEKEVLLFVASHYPSNQLPSLGS